jgi:hypothetical protein
VRAEAEGEVIMAGWDFRKSWAVRPSKPVVVFFEIRCGSGEGGGIFFGGVGRGVVDRIDLIDLVDGWGRCRAGVGRVRWLFFYQVEKGWRASSEL